VKEGQTLVFKTNVIFGDSKYFSVKPLELLFVAILNPRNVRFGLKSPDLV
jgi:hypothetical protein